MEWQEIGQFTLTRDWQYTSVARGQDYKIVFLSSGLSGRNSTGLVALVDKPDDESLDSTEIFKPQKITSYQVSEIIRFPVPPSGWRHRLAIKQLVFSTQPTFSQVKIFMPAYSSAPVFNGSTNALTSSTVPVDSTKSVILSAINPQKIGTTIINNSSKAKLYVSVGAAASLTVYDKILNYLEVYETPFNWSGEVFGIWDKVDAAGNAKVKDFS